MIYDPNEVRKCDKVQVVEVTLQLWGFARLETVRVGGNALGLVVLQSAVEELAERLEYAVLTDAEGRTLDCDLRGQNLEDFVTGVRIVEVASE